MQVHKHWDRNYRELMTSWFLSCMKLCIQRPRAFLQPLSRCCLAQQFRLVCLPTEQNTERKLGQMWRREIPIMLPNEL